MVGWDKGSIAYHADDGCLFNQDGEGMDYGPTWKKKGSVVGCAINLIRNEVFFTHNGKKLSTIYCNWLNNSEQDFHFCIGCRFGGVKVRANFGPRYESQSFLFDFEKLIGMFFLNFHTRKTKTVM